MIHKMIAWTAYLVKCNDVPVHLIRECRSLNGIHFDNADDAENAVPPPWNVAVRDLPLITVPDDADAAEEISVPPPWNDDGIQRRLVERDENKLFPHSEPPLLHYEHDHAALFSARCIDWRHKQAMHRS